MAHIVATDEQLDHAARIWAKDATWQDPQDTRPPEEAQHAALAIARSFLNSPVLEAMGIRREFNK